MEPMRLSESSEIIQFRHNDRAVPIYRAMLPLIADALASKGSLKTGDHEPDLHALTDTLLRYQDRSGLPRTGLPDTATLLSLLPDDQSAPGTSSDASP